MADRTDDDDRDDVSSPACLMHEADPAYMGFADKDELVALLNALLPMVRVEPWPQRLIHHITALGGDPMAKIAAPAPPFDREAVSSVGDCTLQLLRRMLPRVGDDGLHADLSALLCELESDGE